MAFRPRSFPAVADDGRPIQDAPASAICPGMLTRFPGIRLTSVGNGGSWVGHLVRNLELAYNKMPNEFPEHACDVFQCNVWVNPARAVAADALLRCSHILQVVAVAVE